MPCHDATEWIHVEVDPEDRLSEYRYIKLTCGRGVGAKSLLIDALRGASVDSILAMPPEADFTEGKHLAALQAALRVLTGASAGGKDAPCAAARVHYEDGQTIIEARLAVDVPAADVPPCEPCAGCASGK
jgi:hypothetical protein